MKRKSAAMVWIILLHPAGALLGQPLSPEDSIKLIDLEPGFRVEAFAVEPQVVDPVCLAFDETGKVYVAELREMEDLPALEPGTQGTIRLLEDSDGDGRIDRSTLFAEGLSFPTGLAPFKGGLYALCTPDLLYLKDTDGDGRADLREVVLAGFAMGNAEHRFNNLTWSMDHWVYAANGHGGGVVYSPEATDPQKIDLSGKDLRFNPWTGATESVTRNLPGGFGLSFDDWGRRYLCQNEQHAMTVLLEDRYIRRNPHLAVRETGEKISSDGRVDSVLYPISEPQQWRIERTTRRAKENADQFRESQLRVNGYFTAACGVTVYRADLFPEKYYGSLFVCDAAQNLVHRSLLEEKGVRMESIRADEGREFLRSRDQWFRPVNLHLGPDGALYVCDFYREIIETAQSIPEDILAKIDLRAGSDRGRIYRIAPEGAAPYRPADLASKSDEELVGLLLGPNSWERQTAQRLLLEREARTSIPAIREAAVKGEDPRGRVQALWTLEGLEGLDSETILAAVADPHPRVREQAVRLAETLLPYPASGAEGN